MSSRSHRDIAGNAGAAGVAQLVGRPVAALARKAGLAAVAALALAGGGCGTNSQILRPLTAESFAAPPTEGRSIGNPVDRPGPVNYDQIRLVGPVPDGRTATDNGGNAAGGGGAVGNGYGNGYGNGGQGRDIGRAVERTIRPPTVALDTPAPAPAGTTRDARPRDPTRPPSTLPAAPDGGQFDYVGFVLMRVNGQPIFVDKVLKAIERPLETEAKNYGPRDFRKVAEILLDRQVQLFEKDELEFAMAQRALSQGDQAMAQALTIDWRQKQITAAGGSLELARRKAASEGWDFEELTQQMFRLRLIQLYYQKRILPQVFVPRQDIWDFYVENKATLFTSHGQARFRVIKIDPQ